MKTIQFPNLGIIEKKLSTGEIDYLWKCIEDKGMNISLHLLDT